MRTSQPVNRTGRQAVGCSLTNGCASSGRCVTVKAHASHALASTHQPQLPSTCRTASTATPAQLPMKKSVPLDMCGGDFCWVDTSQPNRDTAYGMHPRMCVASAADVYFAQQVHLVRQVHIPAARHMFGCIHSQTVKPSPSSPFRTRQPHTSS